MTDQTDYFRKYGVIDFAPVSKAKPPGRLFTPVEVAELRRQDARMAQIKADAPYLGWPAKPPQHPDPRVREIAEMLLKVYP